MIAIVDYGTGNLFSLASALERCNTEYRITSSASEILSASSVIMPGVGAAGEAMEELRKRGLDIVIPQVRVPLLGICIGMQLLCSYSEEGAAPADSSGRSPASLLPKATVSSQMDKIKCLSIFPNGVKKFASPGIKIPHMGWNTLYSLKTPLFEGIEGGEHLYFVHSYFPETGKFTIATSFHGEEFSAALNRDNFYGTQFHPEKSGAAGERVLKNFISIKL
ncbi:MAG: imidazole glycerol phosphate synthase subunit HisH [Bacteroidales bacterium]|nr:imidazole glycerol phosphate synthase subunit HisH [Bacteroidales bacterium]MDD2425891.1 imidazole glycerol phosphate synthase subunit HisH [Bacteroidales bacterium]MDD3990153.1 imidazole glycerol phosphate synthase subunit HisH [Bacteroidales bacterium]